MITEFLFKKRLIAFYSSWRTHKQLWGHSDIIVVSTPAEQASNLSSSSSSRDFFLWLFEEDLAGTTAVFTPSSIFFVCMHESLYRLRSLVGGYAIRVMNIPVSVEVIMRRNPDEGISKLDKIIRDRRYKLYAAGLICTLSVGCIEEEIPKWKLLLSCLNGYDYFTEFRIAGVNCGVQKLIEIVPQQQMPQQCYNKESTEEEKEFKRQVQVQLEKEKNGVIKERILSVPEQRLRFLYSSWRKYRKELWGNSDVLVVTTPPSGSTIYAPSHPVSSSFFLWLLGGDYPNTTAVFMDQALHIFCPEKSRAKLCILGVYLTSKEVPVSMKVKGSDGDESELLYAAVAAAANDHRPHPVIIGYIDGEAPNSKLDGGRFQARNVKSGFVNLLNDEKEEEEEGGLKSHHQTQSYNKDIIAENYEQQASNEAKASSSSKESDDWGWEIIQTSAATEEGQRRRSRYRPQQLEKLDRQKSI